MSGPPKINHASRFKLALLTGYSSTAVTLVSTFVAVPTMSYWLSTRGMALYLALQVISIFTSFGQLGAGPALTRRVASANSEGDAGKARPDVLASYLICFLAFALSVVPLAFWMCSGRFEMAYGLSPGNFQERVCCSVIAVVACTSIALSPTARVLIGLHRVHIANNANIISNLIILVGILVIVPITRLGYFATACYVIPSVVTVIALTAYVVRKDPGLFFPLQIPGRQHLLEALHGSAAFVAFEICLVLLREGTKITVGQKLGNVDLAKIGIAFFIASQAQSFFSTIVNPMMPIVIDLRKSRNFARAKKIYLTAFTGALGAVILGALLMAWKGPEILSLWTRHKYEFTRQEAIGLEIMAGAYMLRILNGMILFCLGGDWSAVGSTVLGSLLVAGVMLRGCDRLSSYVWVYGCIGMVVFGLLPVPSILRGLANTEEWSPPNLARYFRRSVDR